MEQATNQIQELTLDECDAVSGGLIMIALWAIWNSAQSSTGGNSDMGSWNAA